MQFIVIGISDQANPFFPPEVLETIRRGRVFSGGRRHHDIVAPLLPQDALWIDIATPLDTVFEQYTSLTTHAEPLTTNAAPPPTEIVVFASGDPLFFGFANTIHSRMPDADIRLYPAFNSLQMLAHRLLMPYHDMRTVSLTGRPWPELDRALIERAPKIGILTDREHTPAAIARRLIDYGYCCYVMHIGEHLGNPPEERVTTTTLSDAAYRHFATPNCVILSTSRQLCSDTATAPYPTPTIGAPLAPVSRTFGLPDSSFALLDGREKMITKMPIRLLTLQALELPRRHVLWDIGACTGSVSIEARLLFPHLRVVAFEIRPECEAIISENCRRHHAPGIELHIGDFRRLCCDGIAPPDAVFIGGHGGQLQAIMAKVLTMLAPGGVIVMNSVAAPRVATDSRLLWDDACRQLGLQQEPPMRIQTDGHHPITILKCRKQ